MTALPHLFELCHNNKNSYKLSIPQCKECLASLGPDTRVAVSGQSLASLGPDTRVAVAGQSLASLGPDTMSDVALSSNRRGNIGA